MRRRSVRVVVVALATALVAAAAGCGGGGGGGGGGTTASSGGTTHAMATTMQHTTTASGSGSSFASAKNCQDLAGLAAKAASAIEATSGNPATTLQTEANQLQALANAAPSEIRADFQTFAAAFTSYLHALEKAGFKPGSAPSKPTPAQIAALTQAAKTFSAPKLAKAEKHLNSWVKQNCKGINLGG
jgi:hypothetical protein